MRWGVHAVRAQNFNRRTAFHRSQAYETNSVTTNCERAFNSLEFVPLEMSNILFKKFIFDKIVVIFKVKKYFDFYFLRVRKNN